MTSIVNSYRNQSPPARILRIWLGVTFLYAGWNKASDGAFFTPGSSSYIGTQLTGFAHGSPISGLLGLAAHQPVVVGWVTLLGELAIGIATLLNIASLPAAIGGALLSLMLWLSASWQVHPYFLASDPAYFVMWSSYALMLRPAKIVPSSSKGRTSASSENTPTDLRRRKVVQIGLVGALSVLVGLVGRLLKSSPTAKPRSSSAATDKTSSGGANSSTTPTPANILTSLAALPVGSAANFTAANGDPAILVRTGNSKVCAFDAICTHNGCTVEYDPGSQTLICPCHGAQYDPLSHAAVLAGPAPAPLVEIKVKIDGSNIVLA